ncbi:hypothetical protein CIHG_04455 [Coccidioides immitis H538.4]|uniref:Uncharacterized protein n=3 Tax=Coccidioides immitis TaxID=5501 RepID=A0A0J8R6X1_COCIT|nr:hypothetical protein CIRG_09386 [Coccidioides immitis RMSCC 2394]KMU80779.1 hypothetical protein CISG_08582 [Coccidioides immitis RMSCC 3703]KMU86666.1 hypothetical protein CIHG_04455 [Coccidioides immitis H538.4]
MCSASEFCRQTQTSKVKRGRQRGNKQATLQITKYSESPSVPEAFWNFPANGSEGFQIRSTDILNYYVLHPMLVANLQEFNWTFLRTLMPSRLRVSLSRRREDELSTDWAQKEATQKSNQAALVISNCRSVRRTYGSLFHHNRRGRRMQCIAFVMRHTLYTHTDMDEYGEKCF